MKNKNPTDIVFLVVDDDSQVREIVAEYLNSFGYSNVLQAKNGKEALKIVHNHEQHLDIIISDWEMPQIDGLTLLRAVRKDAARSEVKFMIVSSQSSRERMKISAAGRSRVDAYVVKPFRSQLLKEKVENLIKYGNDKSADEFEENLNCHGFVVVKDTDDERLGKVETSKESLPPEVYNINQMNLMLVIKLVKSYQKVKWHDKAIGLCKKAVVQFPDEPDLIYQLAYSYFLMGNLDEAMLQVKEVTKLEPYHVEGQTLLGELQGKIKTG